MKITFLTSTFFPPMLWAPHTKLHQPHSVSGVEAELPHGRLKASPGEAKTAEKMFFCVNWPFNASRGHVMQTYGATFRFTCPVKKKKTVTKDGTAS